MEEGKIETALEEGGERKRGIERERDRESLGREKKISRRESGTVLEGRQREMNLEREKERREEE